MRFTVRLCAEALGSMLVLFVSAAAAGAAITVTRQDDRDSQSTCQTSLATTPDCSLREAIDLSNASGAAIDFDVKGGGNQIITINSQLPSIIDGQTIDGLTQPNTTSATPIEIKSSNSGAGANGLTVSAGSGAVIEGLAIGDFQGNGIDVGGTSVDTTIESDAVGVEQSGSDLGNGLDGIRIDGTASQVTVGGFDPTDRVVVGDNGDAGVDIAGSATDLVSVEGDYIGLAPNGSTAAPNSEGVLVTGAATNIQVGNGGASPTVISGNHGVGLQTTGTAAVSVNNTIVGLDANGDAKLPNSIGIEASAPDLKLGTCCAATALNTVSGNTGAGILLGTGADSAQILNTHVGTNPAATAALGNGAAGIDIQAADAVIDGDDVIGGNAGDGVKVAADGASVMNAEIGHSATVPDQALPNGGDGIDVVSGINGVVGSPGVSSGPDVADNTGAGLFFATAPTGWSVGGASFQNDGGLGIDLAPAGVTANDASGGHPNFPVITSFVKGEVKGTYHGKPNQSVTINIFQSPTCDPSGNGEGTPFLAGITATTDAAGNATFDQTYPTSTTVDPVLSAEAQSADGVSEFGPCKSQDSATVATLSPATYTAAEGSSSVTITVSRSGNTTATSSFTLATSGGTATSGVDYAPLTTTVAFAAGQTTATVTLTLKGNPALKANATIGLTLSAPAGAILGTPSTGTVTITVPAATPTPNPKPTPNPTSTPKPTGSNQPPHSTISALGRRPTAKQTKRFHGTATDDHGVAKVEISLLKLVRRAKAASGTHRPAPECLALTTAGRLHRQKLVRGRCEPTTFLLATGTTTWTFTLRHALPKGSYVLYSRAIDGQGVAESAFSARLHNRVAFTLR